jgi:uncharacterized protein
LKILIIGVSVRAMVGSAVCSGYPVIALDAFGDQDLRALAESYSLRHDFHVVYSAPALYGASKKLAFDAVAYTSNLENHPGILRRFADGHRILGNSPTVIESVRNWENLFPKLRQAGFLVPETLFANQNREFDPNRRWLVKPVLSGGGRGIGFLQGERMPGVQFLIQEFIPGRPCSASFVANGSVSVILGITEQLVGMPHFGSQGFRYCGNLLPLPEVNDAEGGKSILKQVHQIAAFLTREYGLIGLNGIDFILNGDGVYLTEVNPRYSASMELIEHAYGLPMFQLHAQAVLEGRLPEFQLETYWNNGRFLGKAILFAEREALAPDTRGWRGRGIRDIPSPGEKLHKQNPICTILVTRQTYGEAIAGLISQAAVLKKEIYGQT